MSSNHTNLSATNPDGQKLSVSHTTTDSPILPAANLQQLQQIDPTLVKWVVEQTEKESNHRRSETSKVNNYIFAERISGVIAGALVAVCGLLIAGYLVLKGHDWAGVLIGGATLATIVTVLVQGKKSQDERPPQPKSGRRKK